MTQGEAEYELRVALRKIEILEHALGDPRHFRNAFLTQVGSSDDIYAKELVEADFMFQDASRSNKSHNMYCVTEKGKTLAFVGDR